MSSFLAITVSLKVQRHPARPNVIPHLMRDLHRNVVPLFRRSRVKPGMTCKEEPGMTDEGKRDDVEEVILRPIRAYKFVLF